MATHLTVLQGGLAGGPGWQNPKSWFFANGTGIGGLGATALSLEAQVDRAIGGAPVGTFESAGIPADMDAAPVNVPGAHLRVAFWLATGARILAYREQQQGQEQGWFSWLTSHPSDQLRAAAKTSQRTATLWLTTHATAVGAGKAPADIVAILAAGASTAKQYGLPDVAARIQRLANPQAIAASQEAQPGVVAQLLPDVPAVPKIEIGLPQIEFPWKAIGIGLGVVVLIAMLGAWGTARVARGFAAKVKRAFTKRKARRKR